MAVTPNSVRSTRTLARAVNDGPVVLSWPIARLTGQGDVAHGGAFR